jgi:hypothetical protein
MFIHHRKVPQLYQVNQPNGKQMVNPMAQESSVEVTDLYLLTGEH